MLDRSSAGSAIVGTHVEMQRTLTFRTASLTCLVMSICEGGNEWRSA